MKATGIVRRIDELGRIVIPKEIRKTLRLREGENLEIYTDDDQIILKKYSLMKKLDDFASDFTDSIYTFVKHNIIIADTDKIIAASGPIKKEIIHKQISEELENHIVRRDTMLESFEKEIKLIEDEDEYTGSYTMSTIVTEGDAVGLVLILSLDEKLTETEKRIVEIAANLLSKHLEN